MSITLMSDVWPLSLASTDKLVLLALADAANDEEGHTWIAVKSKRALNRAGRPKLNLVVKTSLSKRAVQNSLRKLENDGHITREEISGIGVNYWVHPVTPKRGAASAPVQNGRGATGSQGGAGDAPEGRASCTQTLTNPKKPRARAGARGARSAGSGFADREAKAIRSAKVVRVKEREAEGEREALIRAGIIERGGSEPPWLARCGIKVCAIDANNGHVGITIYALPTDKDELGRRSGLLKVDAPQWLGVPVRWVNVIVGTFASSKG